MDSHTDPAQNLGPMTLAIDIGGTHLKAGLLDTAGHMVVGPQRIVTPADATPAAVIDGLLELARGLEGFRRISVGFPGVVRHGHVLTAPNLNDAAWRHFPLATTLSERLGCPTRILNDAEVQGLGVIAGRGLECVITLGTGMGFAVFLAGRLAPHLELAHHPVHKDKTYDEFIGNRALRDVGRKRWNKRLKRALGCITRLVNYDTLYIGGGNATHVSLDLPANVHLVSNEAGITGGVRLWDHKLDEAFVAG